MRRGITCNRKGPAPRPVKKAPAKPTEEPMPWWQDDSYNNVSAVVEDPDRYKSSMVNDPPLRRNFY